jgi:methylated-DNA-[protein]-cysteine S-methyltransferase
MATAKATEDIPGLVETHFLSPFGCFRVAGSPRGIRSVSFVDAKPCPAGPIPRVLRDCVKQPLDFSGHTHFHQAVWQELLKIPYGRTTSYLSIADRLGDVKAIRAVGQANRNNPVAIIVPCHRVIAKNGDLQGYFYGLDFKRRLLELENPQSFARQGSLF